MYSAVILAVLYGSTVLAQPLDSATNTISGRQCQGSTCSTSTTARTSRFIPTPTTTFSRTPLPSPSSQNISKLALDMHNQLRRNAGLRLEDYRWDWGWTIEAEYNAERCKSSSFAWHHLYPREHIAVSFDSKLRSDRETDA